MFLQKRGGCATVTMRFETLWPEVRSISNNSRTLHPLVFDFNINHITAKVRVAILPLSRPPRLHQHTSHLATRSMDAQPRPLGPQEPLLFIDPWSPHSIPDRAVAGTSGGALVYDRGAAPGAHYLLRKLIDWAKTIKGGRVSVKLRVTSLHSHYLPTYLDIYLYKSITIATSFKR